MGSKTPGSGGGTRLQQLRRSKERTKIRLDNLIIVALRYGLVFLGAQLAKWGFSVESWWGAFSGFLVAAVPVAWGLWEDRKVIADQNTWNLRVQSGGRKLLAVLGTFLVGAGWVPEAGWERWAEVGTVILAAVWSVNSPEKIYKARLAGAFSRPAPGAVSLLLLSSSAALLAASASCSLFEGEAVQQRVVTAIDKAGGDPDAPARFVVQKSAWVAGPLFFDLIGVGIFLPTRPMQNALENPQPLTPAPAASAK